MHFTFNHHNFNVLSLERSLEFYQKALGLRELRRKEPADGSFVLAFLGAGAAGCALELTWLRDRTEPYDLGYNEFHLAFQADDYEAAYRLHKSMGCVCFENEAMGIILLRTRTVIGLKLFPAGGAPAGAPPALTKRRRRAIIIINTKACLLYTSDGIFIVDNEAR